MSILYNCHTDGTEWRITKFNDGEVESSYLCSTTECQCPAGHRPSCRHRLMLPMFIARGAVNSFWFLDFERKGWVANELKEPAMHWTDPETAIANCERSELGSRQHDDAANIDWDILAEERLGQRPHSPTVTTTDFDSVDDSSILSVAANKPSWRRI